VNWKKQSIINGPGNWLRNGGFYGGTVKRELEKQLGDDEESVKGAEEKIRLEKGKLHILAKKHGAWIYKV